MSLSGKTVVITGASGAIGAAVAQACFREDAQLVLGSFNRPEVSEAAAKAFRSRGGNAIHCHSDVSSPAGAEHLMSTAVTTFGKVDVLLNIAGSTVGAGKIDALSPEDWTSAFASNFYTAVNCCQAAVRHMRERSELATIVNTTSVRGLWSGGRPPIMAYSAAKAAIINFTSTLAKDVAPNILVNAVAPGFVYTPNYDANPQQNQKFIEATLLKRFITVDEVAESYVFLANTTCITGQVLNVDGGFSLKLE